MPKHVFPRGPAWPAPNPTPVVLGLLIAASALGTAALRSPTGNWATAALGADPIALWLDTGARDQRTASEPPADLSALALPSAASTAAAGSGRDAEPVSPDRVTGDGAPGLVAEADGSAASTPLAVDEAGRTTTAEALAENAVDGNVEPAAEAPPETPGEHPAGDALPGDPTGGAIAAQAAAPTSGADGAANDAVPAGEAEQQEEAETTKAIPSHWRDHTVRKGETLAQVLKAFGVDKEDRAKVLVATKETTALTKLKAGQKLRAQIDEDGGLLELQLKLNAKTTLHVELDDDDYRIHEIDRPVEKRVSKATAVIQSSLFSDAQDAGLSDAQIMELTSIFGWDIDFTRGLRPGDRVSVIYEAEYLDGRKVDNGAILAAEFVSQGASYRAVRFEDDDGTLGYYAPDGTSKKQAFLRSPLKLARVSSGFSLSRKHPILNTRRAHKGVDYAAPTGTPVKATGTGLVTFSGQKNGYGKVVEVQHGGNYATLYGHLSRFAEGLRVGEPVKQGEVIGYVGETGLATGPHLHYEFRVAGEHRDPLSTKLPTAMPLDGRDLAKFKKTVAPLIAQLDRLDRTIMARAD